MNQSRFGSMMLLGHQRELHPVVLGLDAVLLGDHRKLHSVLLGLDAVLLGLRRELHLLRPSLCIGLINL